MHEHCIIVITPAGTRPITCLTCDTLRNFVRRKLYYSSVSDYRVALQMSVNHWENEFSAYCIPGGKKNNDM